MHVFVALELICRLKQGPCCFLYGKKTNTKATKSDRKIWKFKEPDSQFKFHF